MRRVKQPTKLTLNEPFPALGKGKTIFVGHMIDMFAGDIYFQWPPRILEHCQRYPQNTYVFQSKDPAGIYIHYSELPPGSILGTTVETNRYALLRRYSVPISANNRLGYLRAFNKPQFKTFITAEPIMDFDVDEFSQMLIEAHPDFINIGADSKGHNLPEPTQAKISELVTALKAARIEVRLKDNLKRLFPW